jgi:Ca2+-binding RTX toxin-like protein
MAATFIFESMSNNSGVFGFKPDFDTVKFAANPASRVKLDLGADTIAFKVLTSDGYKTLTVDLPIAEVTTRNVRFLDGSVLLVGDNGTGNEEDNRGNQLAGTSQDDQILGLGGDDRLYGLAGSDRLDGGLGRDSIVGGAGADSMYGGSGDDVLDGGAGADDMHGASGADVYFVDDPHDRIIGEGLASGYDQVHSAVTFTLSSGVESLYLAGDTAEDLGGTGNDLDNIIVGNSGDNVLDGKAGGDTLTGLSGDDTYIVDSPEDVVREGRAGGGTDTVISTASFVLPDVAFSAQTIENLTLSGFDAIDGRGNAAQNVITGNDNDNRLIGESGDDTLTGKGGNDSLRGGHGADLLIGGWGDDTLTWGAPDTLLDGEGDTDTLQILGRNLLLDLSAASDQIRNIEVLDITGSGDNTLLLGLDEALQISSTTDTLRIVGDAGDEISIDAGWTRESDETIGSDLYLAFSQGGAILLVDADITWSV